MERVNEVEGAFDELDYSVSKVVYQRDGAHAERRFTLSSRKVADDARARGALQSRGCDICATHAHGRTHTDVQDQQDGRGKQRPASGLLHILLFLFPSNIFSGLRSKKNKRLDRINRINRMAGRGKRK